jgi:hypothetical protein
VLSQIAKDFGISEGAIGGGAASAGEPFAG